MTENGNGVTLRAILIAAAALGIGGTATVAQNWNHDQIVQAGKDIVVLQQQMKDMQSCR